MNRVKVIQEVSDDWDNYIKQHRNNPSSGLGGAPEFFEYEDMLQKRVIDKGLSKLNINVHGLKVLDVGCGAGRISMEYFKKGAKVIGIDISKEMLHEAKDRGRSIEYIKYNGINFPFKDCKFDVVSAVAVLPVLENIGITEIVIREMVRVCRKSGYVICLELTPQKQGYIFSPNNYRSEHTAPLSAKKFTAAYNSERCKLLLKMGVYISPFRFVYMYFKNINPLHYLLQPVIIKLSKVLDLYFTKYMNNYSEKNLFIFQKLE